LGLSAQAILPFKHTSSAIREIWQFHIKDVGNGRKCDLYKVDALRGQLYQVGMRLVALLDNSIA
jgi:hypothetical protein